MSVTSTPLRKVTPWTTLGNWFSPFSRRQVFEAAMTSLNTMSRAVSCDSAPLVRTVLCRTVANTLSIGLYQIPEILTFEGFHAAACLIERGEPRRFAVPVSLRPDLDAPQLRAAAKRTKDGPQARRLLALAAIYDGATRAEAATIGGVTLQIVRDWVLKLNARGPEGLIDRKAPGQPSRLTDAHRAAIAAMIESGPVPAVHGVVRWRLVDLCQWLWEEHQVTVSKQTLSRELRAMNYRKLSARPRHHAQADDAVEVFKKASPLAWTRLRAKRPSIPPGSKSGSATRPASARRTS